MNNNLYSGMFAGKKLFFQFRNEETASWFGSFLTQEKGLAPDGTVYIPVSDCDCWMEEYGMLDDGATESGMSVYRASDALLPYNRVIIHAAALLWHGKAYLFSANSGIGKSTQLRHWTTLYSQEAKIMNGDKPVLRLEQSGMISVHPSPWKGKEGWGDDSLTAPLGGIILLKQGKDNSICRMESHRAAPLLLTQFFSMFETKETISAICRFEESLLSNVPVWLLINKGDQASAILTRDKLLAEEGKVNAST